MLTKSRLMLTTNQRDTLVTETTALLANLETLRKKAVATLQWLVEVSPTVDNAFNPAQERDIHGRFAKAQGYAVDAADHFNAQIDKAHRGVKSGEDANPVDLEDHKDDFLRRVRGSAANAWKTAEAQTLLKHGDNEGTRSVLASRREQISDTLKAVHEAATERADHPLIDADKTDREEGRYAVTSAVRQLHKDIQGTVDFVGKYKEGTTRHAEIQEAQKVVAKIAKKVDSSRSLTAKDHQSLDALKGAHRWATVHKDESTGEHEIHTPANDAQGGHFRVSSDGSMRMHDNETKEPTSPNKLEEKRKNKHTDNASVGNWWLTGEITDNFSKDQARDSHGRFVTDDSLESTEGVQERDPIRVSKSAQSIAKLAIGRELTKEEVMGLSGGQKGTVTVTGQQNDKKGTQFTMDMKSRGVGWRSSVYLKYDDKKKELNCFYGHIELQKDLRSTPLAANMLSEQLMMMHKIGVKRIDATAGRDDKNDIFGYRVWPKMGFDGDIPKEVIPKLSEGLRKAKTIQELYAMPGGKKEWEEHGVSFPVHLDLESEAGKKAIGLMAKLKARAEKAKGKGE